VSNADGSRFFGSPTKLFEYMAMGKAIVASDLDQIGEVLANSLRADKLPASDEPVSEDNLLSLLCEPGSATQIADGIRFLASHPRWRAALGANARSEALSRYTWNDHVEAILAGLATYE
jgi:glycosyltransferase involved in cell wall biosynthesis